MMEFVSAYWQAILPTLLTGFYLLTMLKRIRREAAARQAALKPLPIEKR